MAEIVILPADDMAAVRELWTEYWELAGLAPNFQGFAQELASLPGIYAPPAGQLLLAWVDDQPAGTAAFRRLGDRSCEAKRLYVRPAFRGLGLGRALLDRLVGEARSAGYSEMFCDTLPSMVSAQRMYREYGFETVAPYSAEPTPGAVFLRLVL